MLGMLRFFALVAASTVLFSTGTVAVSADLGSPSGPIILSIRGSIDVTNSGDAAHFDRALLEDLGLVELRTETPWTKGMQVFEGVSVERLLDAVGANGMHARATALNDYSVDIDLRFAEEANAIIALKMNGEYMRVRDKGPLWIVFPWKQFPALQEEYMKSISIWQLSQLEIR